MKEKLQRLKALSSRIAVGTAVAVSPMAVFAADEGGGGSGVDLSSVTSAINVGTVGTAIAAVAGAMAMIYVGIKGAKIVLSMIRGA